MAIDSRRPSNESVSSASLCRSRTWSEDVQKHWNLPVLSTETLEQRLDRYTEYFSLSEGQVKHVFEALTSEVEEGLLAHKTSSPNPSSVKMLDTCIENMPTGQEKGIEYCLNFNGSVARALRTRLEGNGRVSTVEHKKTIRDEPTSDAKGLLDRKCGAMELFDYLAGTVGELIEMNGLAHSKTDIPLALSAGFPCYQRNLKSATLLEWTKGFETGRATSDPVEGLDVVTLLDMAFWRKEIPVKVSSVTNEAAATLLACAYEKPSKLPPCTVAFLVGVGMNGAYIEPNAAYYGYKGTVINTEVGGFDKGLPVTDVDLEIDWADEGGHGKQVFEKMVAGGYLGEVCRRLVIKVWQTDAPTLAWARQSLPTAAAALVVSDLSENLEVVDKLIQGLWSWETDFSTRQSIQKMFALVFDRSAGLAACGIAALAKKSGRLQPAMGGVTVAVDGTLHTTHPWYSDSVRRYLKQILGDTAHFVHLYVANDGPGKGAAVLAHMVKSL